MTERQKTPARRTHEDIQREAVECAAQARLATDELRDRIRLILDAHHAGETCQADAA
ncbi:hypothetical protein [Nocardiopsis lucentensis]|uniref:hypothetical protein n=1 Tax=Nocardiopsis lucentensis TaxID=53441 RepID=UPI00037AF143|nr:hypothetical protein [Nocardiopsis lucentensis]